MFEFLLKMRIEELEEGGFLATSDELQGLVAQGRTIAETIEIIESCLEDGNGKVKKAIFYQYPYQ